MGKHVPDRHIYKYASLQWHTYVHLWCGVCSWIACPRSKMEAMIVEHSRDRDADEWVGVSVGTDLSVQQEAMAVAL